MKNLEQLHLKKKRFATASVRVSVIEDLIGTQVFNVAEYFIQRGASRFMRTEVITDSVKKDYNLKRKALQTKIEKLSGTDSIISLTEVTIEKDGKLGCYANLDNGDRIQIYTIIAGGWNIQKFHFRGLAKRLQK